MLPQELHALAQRKQAQVPGPGTYEVSLLLQCQYWIFSRSNLYQGMLRISPIVYLQAGIARDTLHVTVQTC